MTKVQYRFLIGSVIFLILLMLGTVLPPVGWAILALVALSFGMCWLVERAITRVWRR